MMTMMNKNVIFNPVPCVIVLHTWQYAYRQARKGPWEQYARDTARFKQRIEKVDAIISAILKKDHHHKMYMLHHASSEE